MNFIGSLHFSRSPNYGSLKRKEEEGRRKGGREGGRGETQ
jgi:hypothetical protein